MVGVGGRDWARGPVLVLQIRQVWLHRTVIGRVVVQVAVRQVPFCVSSQMQNVAGPITHTGLSLPLLAALHLFFLCPFSLIWNEMHLHGKTPLLISVYGNDKDAAERMGL